MKLFPFQEIGAQWLSTKKHALLADEMGLGKSAQAIIAADSIGGVPILVLCPAVARTNWTREWSKFSSRKLRLCVIEKATDATKALLSDVIICSYDLMTNSAVWRAVSQLRFAICFLDEAHYLKEPSAGRANAVLGKGGIAHHAERIWCLTGTPAPNNPSELWTILYTLFPETITGGGVLRKFFAQYCSLFSTGPMDFETFRDRFCVTRETPFGTVVTGGRRLDELRARIAPTILRRRKVEVMKELPAISFHDLVIEPTKIERSMWERHFTHHIFAPHIFNQAIDKELRLVETLADDFGMKSENAPMLLEALAPRVKTLRMFIGLQKVPKVLELLKAELDAGAYDKIVLFAVHKMVIEELRDGLRDYGAVLLYGGTPPTKRQRHIDRFQNDPKCRVFVGQTVAAGTAISLTAAHQVMVVEADWTPANNQQAVMRCHRIGQIKPVTVRFVGMAGSLDERIQQVLKNKTRVLTALFDK